MGESRSRNQRARVRPLTGVLGMCALAATLLLWTKLRLVNGIPRTAVAEPMPELTHESRPGVTSPGSSRPNADRPTLPKGDAPPSPNEDWSKRDRIPPLE